MWGDRRDEQIRYLVRFDDGALGIRFHGERLEAGAELVDGSRFDAQARSRALARVRHRGRLRRWTDALVSERRGVLGRG